MLKYLAGVVLVFGLAIYVSVQDERAAQQATAKSTHLNKDALSTKSDEDHSQQNINQAEWNLPRWYRFFRWGDGTTTWVIVLTLLAIAEQTSETKRATDSQRDKDRARLIVTGFRDNESLGDENALDPYWSISILLKQQGPTKAFNVRGFGAIVVKRADELRPTMSRKKMTRLHDIPSIVGEEPVLTEPVIGFGAIKDTDMVKINIGELRAHFFGFIEYDDVFGGKHTTRFRYVWQPEVRADVPGVPGETFQVEPKGWEVNGRKKDNHAD